MDKREVLAEYAHEAWSGWMKYMLGKAEPIHRLKEGTERGVEKCLLIPEWAVERWTRQMNMSYAELPENEKQSDREEADKMLAIMNTQE